MTTAVSAAIYRFALLACAGLTPLCAAELFWNPIDPATQGRIIAPFTDAQNWTTDQAGVNRVKDLAAADILRLDGSGPTADLPGAFERNHTCAQLIASGYSGRIEVSGATNGASKTPVVLTVVTATAIGTGTTIDLAPDGVLGGRLDLGSLAQQSTRHDLSGAAFRDRPVGEVRLNGSRTQLVLPAGACPAVTSNGPLQPVFGSGSVMRSVSCIGTGNIGLAPNGSFFNRPLSFDVLSALTADLRLGPNGAGTSAFFLSARGFNEAGVDFTRIAVAGPLVLTPGQAEVFLDVTALPTGSIGTVHGLVTFASLNGGAGGLPFRLTVNDAGSPPILLKPSAAPATTAETGDWATGGADAAVGRSAPRTPSAASAPIARPVRRAAAGPINQKAGDRSNVVRSTPGGLFEVTLIETATSIDALIVPAGTVFDPAKNSPPAVNRDNRIADQSSVEDSGTAIEFTVSDIETAAGDLLVSATSGDQARVKNGNLTVANRNGACSLAIKPEPNANGRVAITVSVTDSGPSAGPGSNALTTTATFILDIAAANDAPTIAAIGAQATNEDTAKAVAFVVADVDGDALTTTAVVSNESVTGLIASGVVNNAASTVLITPAANRNGTATITLTVNDGKGGAASTAFTLTVTAVNDAPTINGNNQIANQTTAEDAAKTVTFAVADVETAAGALVVSAVSANQALVKNANLTVTNVNGACSLAITPEPNANGSVAITVSVTDSGDPAGTVANVLTTTATFTLAITAVNDAPVAAGGTLAVTEDVAKDDNLVANDIDSAALTFAIASQGTLGVATIINAATGAFTYTPNANANGTDAFTFTASDGALSSKPATITVAVAAVNDAPVAADGTLAVTEDVAKAGTLVAGDIDSAALTFAIATQGALGVATIVDAATGAFTYTPNADVNGTDTFTFTASDGALTSQPATITVTIAAVNDAPTITDIVSPPITVNASTGPLPFTIADIDSVALTVTATSGNPALIPDGNLVLGGSGGARTITATPLSRQSGSAAITVTVSDGAASASTGFTVSVVEAGQDVVTAAAFARATDCFVEGTSDVVVVSLGIASTVPVSVPFTVAGGTAVSEGDFSVLTASPLVFAPGQTEARIAIRFAAEGLADADREDDEQFAIVLGEPTGAGLGGIAAFTGTIAGQRDGLRVRVRGSDLAVSPAAPLTAAAGEAVALTIFDGVAPYTVLASGAAVALGTLDCANLDAGSGDADSEPVQTALATLGGGSATLTVRDATGAEITIVFAPQALPPVVVTPPVVLPSLGGVTIFTSLCPGTSEGLGALKAALAGRDGTQAKAFAWDATTQAYVQLPAEPVGGLTPAHAIFLATRVDLGLDFTGTQVPAPFPVLLRPGFNFIGIPPLADGDGTLTGHDIAAPGDFDLTDLAGNLIGGSERTKLIGDKAFLWNGVAYVEISADGPTSVLATGSGYWVLNQSAEGESFLLVRRANVANQVPTASKARTVRKLGDPPPPPTERAARASSSNAGGGGCGHGSGFAALALGLLMLALRRWR